MNFQVLKGMIDSLIQTYKCPSCGSDIIDNNVDIVGAAGTNINIDVECPSCNKHSMIKAEIMSFDFNKMNITKENLNILKDNLFKLKDTANNNGKSTIKDEEIVNLNKKLKQLRSISDLFDQK